MRLKGGSWFAIILMAIMVVIIADAFTFGYFQSALLPVLWGSLVFILAGFQLWREVTGREGKGPKKKAEELRAEEMKEAAIREEVKEAKRTSLFVLSMWTLAFTVAILLFGHLISVAAFIIAYMRWRGRGWIPSAIMALGMDVFFYGLFTVALRTQLFQGYIYAWITGVPVY